MNQGKYVFSQIMSHVMQKDFDKCVNRYNGNWKTKHFTCWKQYLCMAFGQLTHRESLSDTMLCLNQNADKLYHLGIGQAVSKSTLSKSNENRDWRIYRDLTMVLIGKAQRLYVNKQLPDINLKNNVFAIDASLVDLCLDVFTWAYFRQTKAAVKINAQLDLKSAIPTFIHITEGNIHEVNTLDLIDFEPKGFYVMDRGYLDFTRLYKIHLAKAFFVIRGKRNLKFNKQVSNKVDKTTGLRCDQLIKLSGLNSKEYYPEKLRRIKFYDAKDQRMFVFLTNNMEIKALEVAILYKHRWKIELFFKWIKQHLKIKSFWGHSQNAVKTQIWIAISVYVLIAIVKKRLKIQQSMYEILQILSINILDKKPVKELFAEFKYQNFKEQNCNQLRMF